MRTTARNLNPGFFAALLFTLIFLFAYAVSYGQGQIIMKGMVITANATEQRAYGEIIASDGERMPLSIKPNGRFWVCAPANESYILRFSQPGCITKEVIVDARRACPKASSRDRKVEFDVLLHAEDADQALRFAAPVGRIEFKSSRGDAHVSHHYELVPVSSFTAEEKEEPEE